MPCLFLRTGLDQTVICKACKNQNSKQSAASAAVHLETGSFTQGLLIGEGRWNARKGKSMKTIIRNLLAAMLVAASFQTHAQALIYDQQTTNPPSYLGDYFNLQADSPLMQSFVPTLSAVRFAQFQFWDMPNNGTNGATVYVNLWTGSPNTNSATFLASTTPVFMPQGFGAGIAGVTNFFFSTLIGLTAGQTYYLQPVVLSGDNPWAIKVNNDSSLDYYPDGNLYSKGQSVGIDLWFREGVVVPEPSTLTLVGLGGLLVFTIKCRSKLVVLFVTGILFTATILPV
jgi:hypothetical protein